MLLLLIPNIAPISPYFLPGLERNCSSVLCTSNVIKRNRDKLIVRNLRFKTCANQRRATCVSRSVRFNSRKRNNNRATSPADLASWFFVSRDRWADASNPNTAKPFRCVCPANISVCVTRLISLIRRAMFWLLIYFSCVVGMYSVLRAVQIFLLKVYYVQPVSSHYYPTQKI